METPLYFIVFYCNKMRIDALIPGFRHSSGMVVAALSRRPESLVILPDILFEIYSLSLSGNRANDNMVTFSSSAFVNIVIFRGTFCLFLPSISLIFPPFARSPSFTRFPPFARFPPFSRFPPLVFLGQENWLSLGGNVDYLHAMRFCI